MLFEDFNLYHSRWRGPTIFNHHYLAEDLIRMVAKQNMELTLLEGAISWKKRGSQNTLDHNFIPKDLEELVMRCQTYYEP